MFQFDNFTITVRADRPRQGFMTSLDVIRDIMNVPMEAIHAIARMNGISTADDHKKIVTLSQLLPFVEAFERKSKNYFVNSVRNSAQLTPQELQTFTEFCKTFKKENVSLDKVSNWSHIGKAQLREYFVNKIKEKTPSLSTHHTIPDLFSGCSGFNANLENALASEMESVYYERITDDNLSLDGSVYSFNEYQLQYLEDVLERITTDWCYHAKIEKKVCYNDNISDIVRQIVLSARYYVYIDDDDDHELLNDTRIVNKYRVLKEVA